ncbi:unnamed protein product [Darwinula stevensoni]|uniref:Dishevelled n=1 Tax=Darwinula stevensoni TaxID=69355 RepID=A0A7R8XBH8_9CRUS|nr:unnamed protein product [Darwinula stevensoni]CAG0892843.1 unnamed protein product [Darwinula stevensoni]
MEDWRTGGLDGLGRRSAGRNCSSGAGCVPSRLHSCRVRLCPPFSVVRLCPPPPQRSIVSGLVKGRGRDRVSSCPGVRVNGHSRVRMGGGAFPESGSVVSSDLESTSFDSDEDDGSSRITTTTERSSLNHPQRLRVRSQPAGPRPRRRHHPPHHRAQPPLSRTSSLSSVTDSTMSLNIITITLNKDVVDFLGISIIGESNQGGDGGIYVGSIMKGGAVALDGRIEPGDMILQVNDINFENMSNDDAVRVLREATKKPGPIKMVVAKCWDPNPKGYFTIPRTEPVRPIDPGAWVAHTAICRGDVPGRPPSVTTLTSTSSSINSSLPESDRTYEETKLTLNSDMGTIVRAMAHPESGLEIRDRMWLKITIPNAFIGADVVEWLYAHVEGFADRREARKYAAQMLKAGLIKHTVNKITFSEQCYYIFGDLVSQMSHLRLADGEAETCTSEVDRDTVGPLPPPSCPHPQWVGGMGVVPFLPPPPRPGQAPSAVCEYGVGGNPPSYAYAVARDPSGRIPPGMPSAGPSSRDRKSVSPGGSGTGSDTESRRDGVGNGSSASSASGQSASTVTSGRLLTDPTSREMSASKQSFHLAMGNPASEFFVDIM